MALLRKQLSTSEFKFSRKTCIRYSRQQSLPPGSITEFVWKDYCPNIFRNLQELGEVDHEKYMLSICRQETLMEVSLRGACGRPFYLPHDNQFVIKTLRKSEVKVLLEMLPNYLGHIKKYRKSILVRFYGLHAVTPNFGGQKVYFVVMENLLQSELQIHRRFDLKGSSQGRTINRGASVHQRHTLKDLDFDLCFYLNPWVRDQLLEQIKHDCKFLEEQGIMDYSLLLGIHIQHPSRDQTEGVTGENLKAQNQREVAVSDSSSPPHHKREPTLADFFPLTHRHGPRFGTQLPARANQIPQGEKESTSSRRVRESEDCNVLLYFGIIDFLQNYNMIKRLEHAYKSLHYNSKAIPAVPPRLYSTRFLDFLCRVFQAEDLNSERDCLRIS